MIIATTPSIDDRTLAEYRGIVVGRAMPMVSASGVAFVLG